MIYKKEQNNLSNIDKTLSFYFGWLILILMVIVFSAATLYFNYIIQKEQDRLGSVIANSVGDSINRVSFSGKYQARLLVEDLKNKNENIDSIIIQEPSGFVIAHTSKEYNGKVLKDAFFEEAKKVIETDSFAIRNIVISRDKNKIDMIEIDIPYKKGYQNEVTGVTRVLLSTEILKESIREALLYLASLIVLLVFIAYFVVKNLSARISAPIKNQAYQLQGILHYAPLAIYISNPQNEVVASSEEFKVLDPFMDNLKSDLQNEQLVFDTGEIIHYDFMVERDETELFFSAIKCPIAVDENLNVSLAATIALDITNRKIAEQKLLNTSQQLEETLKAQQILQEQLQEERNRFALAIEGAQDGLWDWNLKTNELWFSERFETMLGYDTGDLSQTIESWSGLLHPDDKKEALAVVQAYLDEKGKKSYENSFRMRAKDGSWRWILGRGKAQFEDDGTPLRFVGFNTDISEQKEYQEKLDHTAKHDSLTNLPNRFLLSELLTHSMHSVKRNNKHLALLFIDLDGFKEINDTYGHKAGDEVLSIMAHRMNKIVRSSDIVSRLGGDEFVIVISDLKDSSEVTPTLQRLLSELASNIVYEGDSMHVSVSIGVSFYPQADDIGTEALLRQADQAMYSAKLLGKNQYQFFNIEATQELKEQQEHILSLREAIKMNQLVLYYQPKVDIKNNHIIGLEALLRWNHPTEDLLYPDSFLPLVEHESRTMIELGRWVFENAFAQLSSWHKEGLEIALSINVSSYEIQQQDFSAYLKELFKKYPDIKPNTIELEILETAAFDNFQLTSNTLRECQALGVSIAIDDFGTGYASLHYLKKLPMDTLKIDKSFVQDLLHSTKNLSIVEASIGLAHAFNCHVVAEGVESEEQGRVLFQLGCETAQGYAIAQAMPPQVIKEWMHSWLGYESWKSIDPINEERRLRLYAKVEHRSWVHAIVEFIEGKTSILPQLGLNQCQLNHWIERSVSDEQRLHSEFKTLTALHIQLHDYAEKLLRASKKDQLAGRKKLENLSDELIQKLEALSV